MAGSFQFGSQLALERGNGTDTGKITKGRDIFSRPYRDTERAAARATAIRHNRDIQKDQKLLLGSTQTRNATAPGRQHQRRSAGKRSSGPGKCGDKTIAVRDSKTQMGPALSLTGAEWHLSLRAYAPASPDPR